jgi:hypothetical protein
MKFFNRGYLLQIGDTDSGKGLAINELQVTFSVKKSVNNKEKQDTCKVSITNLSEESLTHTETAFSVASLFCGYGDELVRLFYGQVSKSSTEKKGTDRVTTLEITPYITELKHRIISSLVPENGTVRDVIESIRKDTSIAKGVYRGANLDNIIVYGYPISGTPHSMLDQICNDYRLQWKIEGEALYINDIDSSENPATKTAPVLNKETGLINKPYFFSGSEAKSSKDDTKKRGAKFTALLNPTVRPGGIVRVDYDQESVYLRIEEVEYQGDFRNTNWYMHCTCSIRQEV